MMLKKWTDTVLQRLERRCLEDEAHYLREHIHDCSRRIEDLQRMRLKMQKDLQRISHQAQRENGTRDSDGATEAQMPSRLTSAY